MKININKDISSISSIPKKMLDKISSLTNIIICDSIQELNQEDNVLEVNFSFGKLLIVILDEELKYKFIPSKQLETDIKNTLTKGENPLIKEIDKKLIDNIIKIYNNFNGK